ncbi:MAG: hypothetical protein Q4E75_00150 [bacterium]|nr:hypothetical protein [bacterium]
MKKIFGNFNISYKFLILFSIIVATVVAILNRISLFNNTSFQDIAIYVDMWIIFAIFIIVNCKSVKEAIIKCFLFFLISQPLIYFVELIIDIFFRGMNFKDTFILYFRNYYIGSGWFFLTILTIPGSFIAYQIKKNNIFSSLILSIATSYLSIIGTKGLLNTIFNNFPYHLLNSSICLFMSFLFIFIILKNKKERMISLIITIIGVVIGCILFYCNYVFFETSKTIYFTDPIIIVDYKVENYDIVDVNITEAGSVVEINQKGYGNTKVVLIDNNKEEYVYFVESSKKYFYVE